MKLFLLTIYLYTSYIHYIPIFKCNNFYILYLYYLYTMQFACNLKLIILFYCVVKLINWFYFLSKKQQFTSYC